MSIKKNSLPPSSALKPSSLWARVKRRLWLWAFLVLSGVIAYGFGLLQGSHYRIQRSLASESASK